MHTSQSVISRRKPETERRPSVIKQDFYKNVRRSDFAPWPDEKIRQHPRYRSRRELARRDVISHDEGSQVKMLTSIRHFLSCCQGRLMYVQHLQKFNKINAKKTLFQSFITDLSDFIKPDLVPHICT